MGREVHFISSNVIFFPFNLATEDAFRQPWYFRKLFRSTSVSTDRRSSTVTCSSDVSAPVQPNIGESQVTDSQNSIDPQLNQADCELLNKSRGKNEFLQFLLVCISILGAV